MSENPQISMITHDFLVAASEDLERLAKSLANIREREGDASLDTQTAERQIEHYVGGFISAVEGVKDLEAFSGGTESRLPFIKESLEFYLDMRFNEKTILKAVEEGDILEQDNPIPAMRHMQRILKDDFGL